MFISTTVYLWSSNLAGWLNAKRSFLLSCGSSDFDFCYMIWRFRTQSHYRLVALLLLLLLRRNLSGISGICNKKIFCGPTNSSYTSIICCCKMKFFWSFLFLDKSQGKKISQKLLDKCSHQFICLKERKFPRDCLINAATSLFAYH